MQKKKPELNLIITTIILSIIGVVLAAVNYTRYKINTDYSKIINNTELVGYIEENSPDDIKKLIQNLGYNYQYISDGKIAEQSIEDLPKPTIFNVSVKTTQGVLEETPQKSVSKLLPYIAKKDHKVYLVALVASGLDSRDYYLIYSQLL